MQKPIDDFSLLMDSDSYKFSHWKQYPKGTTKIVSYLESRVGGIFSDCILFGLKPIIKKLEGPVVTRKRIDDARRFCTAHFGADHFNLKGWNYILKKYKGYLPIKIKALPEGTLTKSGVALLTIENTDPNCFWLTNFLETRIMRVWYTSTIATNSFHCKELIMKYMSETCDTLDALPFSLHDFGARALSGSEQAGLGGMAHLTSFMGTDTLMGISFANIYYNDNYEKTGDYNMYGFSVPASEHSTATPYGPGLGEDEYVSNMLRSYPTGIVSLVIDSYDTFNFARNMSKFKSWILGRDGRVVLRPDSGDPVEVNMELLNILWGIFGGHVNSKGYKVLDTHIRILQGDGIDLEMIGKILEACKANGYANENIIFGSGGGLLQKFNRDSLRFAIKCSFAIINDKEVNVQKNPHTDSTKKSKTGELKTILSNNEYVTISSNDMPRELFDSYLDKMIPVFENGKILVSHDFSEIRDRVQSFL